MHLGNCDPAAAFTTAGEHGADPPAGRLCRECKHARMKEQQSYIPMVIFNVIMCFSSHIKDVKIKYLEAGLLSLGCQEMIVFRLFTSSLNSGILPFSRQSSGFLQNSCL